MRMKKVLKDNAGNVSLWVIGGIVVFFLIILPVVSQIIERHRVNIIRNDTVTAVDLALRSAIVSLEEYQAESQDLAFDSVEFRAFFESYLAKNMNLNADLTPTDNALVDGAVIINELDFHGSAELPFTSPVTGKTYNRPYFSVKLRLIIAPSLYREAIQKLVGISEFHYTFYYDVSLPIDI